MKKHTKQILAMILSVILAVSAIPMIVFASGTAQVDTTAYDAFVKNLKQLEVYADSYAPTAKKDAAELVLNYIRTGVKKYNTDTWATMAGAEITGFVTYVAAQDTANGTTAADLRELSGFKTPNGLETEFDHMIGAMNMAYYNKNNADLGSWAGDLCDIIALVKGDGVTGELEAMTSNILNNYLGVDHEGVSSFGILDIRGDLDAFYLMAQLRAGQKLSVAMESYYTASQTDADRAAYFMNNRFDALLTRADVRNAIYSAYKADVGITILEADNGIGTEAIDATRREACCYAFADYLYNLAGDRLTGESKPTDPDDPDTPSTPGTTPDNPYYTVFSQSQSTLAPGVTQTIKFAQTTDGKQIAYYVASVDLTRKDLTIQAGYKDHDPSKGWGMSRVTDQVAAAYKLHSNPADKANYIENFNVIAATNADFYNMSNGRPTGGLVMNGVTYKAGSNANFFAILKDGTPVIGTGSEWATYADNIQEAVGASSILVRNGEIVDDPSGSYYGSRHSRTAIGITADGHVIMMALDGRQEPFSAGGSLAEVAQIMVDAGCVIAVNLDGGGSTTFVSKGEGKDSVSVVNRPSDGFERSVSTSLMVVSTAKVSNEFDRAVIESEYDYLTPGTTLDLAATGVSGTGNAAQIPANAVWQSSNASVATVNAAGVVTAVAVGEVEIQLVVDGVVVGTKKLNVVIPDALAFEKMQMNVIYGVSTPLNFVATYNGNPVAINPSDVAFEHSADTGVEFEGFNIICSETSGVRILYVYVYLEKDISVDAIAMISLYKDGEAIFDFDNATSGDKEFAWDRDVTNATTEDGIVYQIVKPNDKMQISYVFALDMEAIPVPEKLQPLMSLVAGGDVEGATAWSILLQLAERVNPMTNVTVTLQMDKNLDLDTSNVKLVNDFFTLTSTKYDPATGVLTLKFNFVKRSQAVDPMTANSICIVSGLVATPKADAAWNANNRLTIANVGTVAYDIYLRATALYNFANNEANQKEYDIYPFIDTVINPTYNAVDKGGHFAATYVSFEDKFILDRTNRQGWYSYDSRLYYFVDNVALTGLQYVPSYEDPSVKLYYNFADDGSMLNKHTGLIEKDGKLTYSMQGELKKGWQSVLDDNGDSAFYYFDPYTYDAVDGECKVEGYNYLFVDHKCVRGEIVKTAGGLKYRFAGLWQRNQWIELDGKRYYIERDYYIVAGCFKWTRTWEGTSSAEHYFDENGVWRQDYTGIYNEGSNTYYIEGGIKVQEAGLKLIDGYYYYFASNAKAVKNTTYWISVTNGLLPAGPYKFDAQGRMIDPPSTEPDQPPVTPDPDPDPTPDPDPDPETPVKNGVVEELGVLYYYVNGKLAYNAGLVKLEDGSYIYVRSNGRLAIGNYWITNHNDLLPLGVYTFGADGKMVEDTEEPEQPPVTPDQPPVEPPKKNGIVEEYGILYYYKDGARQYCAGLLQLEDGSYIYVRSNAQLAIGNYWVTHNNGLLPSTTYLFDTNGKMVNPPSTDPGQPEQPPVTPEPPVVKNGVVEENGAYYYYVNGTIAYAAGVVQLEDGAYIYVRSNGQLATGVYWPTNTNGLLTYKAYDWGTNGKLYL